MTLGSVTAPVFVQDIVFNSPAERSGLRRGAAIVSINSVPSKFLSHDEVLLLIRAAPVDTPIEVCIQGGTPSSSAFETPSAPRARLQTGNTITASSKPLIVGDQVTTLPLLQPPSPRYSNPLSQVL